MEETAVYTVTLNPAWDRTAAVEGLLCGGTNLLRAPRGDAGGKGINVSRVLHALGKKTEALGLLGAGAGDVLLARLRAEGIRCDFVRLAGECRTNTKVIDLKSGVTTEFNEPGPQADAASLAALEEKLRSLPREAVVVLAGSMPPGGPGGLVRAGGRKSAAAPGQRSCSTVRARGSGSASPAALRWQSRTGRNWRHSAACRCRNWPTLSARPAGSCLGRAFNSPQSASGPRARSLSPRRGRCWRFRLALKRKAPSGRGIR